MCSRPQQLVQLLLLAAFCPCLLAGPFDSYIVNPASYLDAVRPTSSSKGIPAAAAAPVCSGSSTAACAEGSSRHLVHTAAQQTAGAITSQSEASRTLKSVTAHSRGLLQAANPARLLPPYNVCVSSWAPMVRCTHEMEQSEYNGYQIELFRMAASEVGWGDDEYVFTCMDYTVMMEDLNDPAGNCTVVATGVDVSPENLAAGLKFSWPTYKSGLRIMIHAHLQTGSTWAFSEIFRWEVWLMLGATGIAVGLLIGLLEKVNRADAVPESDSGGLGHNSKKRNWQSWQWYSLAKMVHVVSHVGDPGSDASRVLMLGYGFLVLVMVSMYTAVAASRMTAAALVHPVHTVEDLAGANNQLTSLTWQQYAPALLERHGVHAVGLPWERDRKLEEREGDLQAMVDDLRAKQYTALILDAPVLEYVTGTNEECDLFTIGDVFETFSLALAFPPAADDAMVFDFSKSIVSLQTYQGALDMLENVYIKTGGTDKCFGSDAGGHGSGETIALQQVSGLWYILLIAVGICMMMTLAHNVRKHPGKMARVRRLSSFLGSSMRKSEEGRRGRDATGGRSAALDALVISESAQPSAVDTHPQPTQQQQQQQRQGARAPSHLQMFLGTQRHTESDDELDSPASPKKMPLPRAPQ